MFDASAIPSARKQSRMMSLIEAITNVVVGYALAILTQIVVFPWFGIDTGLTEHLTIGLAFVGVSLLRGYVLRRFFEAIAHESRFDGRDRLRPRYTRFPPGSGPRCER